MVSEALQYPSDSPGFTVGKPQCGLHSQRLVYIYIYLIGYGEIVQGRKDSRDKCSC